MKHITSQSQLKGNSAISILNPSPPPSRFKSFIKTKSHIVKTTVMLVLMVFYFLPSFSQNALHFASSSTNYVIIPNASQLNLGTTEFTMEAVVKMPNGQGNFPTILSKRANISTSSPGFTWYIYNGQLAFQIRGINTNGVGPDLRDDSCHHIAVVRDSAGKVTGYVDGVAYTMANINNLSMNNTEPIIMGWDDTEPNTSKFLGVLDEVRIWNTVRTNAQINAFKNTTISTSSAGLVAYYQFNQGLAGSNNTSISNLTDAIAANNGSFTGFTMTGTSSNFVNSCITDKAASCDFFKTDVNDTNCCQAGIIRTMSGGPNVIRIKFNISGGVAQGYTSNCPNGLPVSANIGGFASHTINFPPCNMQTFITSLQSTTASGNMVATYTVYFSNGDSCIYTTNVVGCPRAPVSRCDRLVVSPYTYPGLDLSGRRFTILNQKSPSSPICKILIALSPIPSQSVQGGGLQARSGTSLIFPPTPGTYFAAPYSEIPSGSGAPWPLFSQNTLSWVKFNLGVDFTINWSGTVSIKVIHCDGDTCTFSYNWNATRSPVHQQFTTTQKMNDSLFAVSLTLGLPAIKNKTIKWLGVEITNDNSEFFSITGSRYEVEKKIDNSRLPLSSSEQSSNFALFELDDNLNLDGSGSQLPINMVFRGQRPMLRLVGYDENGNEVIADTLTVQKNVAGVYQMAKQNENKIGLMAYPNPSANEVTLSYFIEDASDVELTVFDITGNFINSYVQGNKAAGKYEFKIDNSSLVAGTYIVKIKTDKYTKSVIMQIVK